MKSHQPRTDYGLSSEHRSPFLVLVTIAAALVLIAGPAAAHPPADISLKYDDDAQELSVTITHPVSGEQDHYIRNVQVKENNVVSSDTAYKSQPAGDSFTYVYTLPLQPGDTVRVTATCSLGPSLTKTLDITSPARPTTGQTAAPGGTQIPVQTQKSAIGLLPFIGTAAFLLFRRKK